MEINSILSVFRVFRLTNIFINHLCQCGLYEYLGFLTATIINYIPVFALQFFQYIYH